MKDYPYRDCPHCDDVISKINSKGNKMRKSKYAERKTCGRIDCRSDSWHSTHETRYPQARTA